MSIQIEINRAANLRRNPPPQNMNQTNSSSQIRNAIQTQNPGGIIETTADIPGISFNSDIDRLRALRLSPTGAGSPLANDGTVVEDTDGTGIEIEGAEVGIVDGELRNEGEVEGRRRGVGAGDGEFGDRERREAEGGGIDAEDD